MEKKYIVVTGVDQDCLERDVNVAMGKGYVPVGSVSYVDLGGVQGFTLAQSMILVKIPKVNYTPFK
jgi:hypothetical protein